MRTATRSLILTTSVSLEKPPRKRRKKGILEAFSHLQKGKSMVAVAMKAAMKRNEGRRAFIKMLQI